MDPNEGGACRYSYPNGADIPAGCNDICGGGNDLCERAYLAENEGAVLSLNAAFNGINSRGL